MRAVRCEVCGSRAMTAAAQCPTCAHHFDLRDARGELFPLAYCSSCQSYYRESLGECRWCHTKPERPPIGPRVWRGVGAAALVALVITARLLQDDGSLDSAIQHAKTAATKNAPPLPVDTALARSLAGNTAPPVQAPVARPDTAVVADTTPRDSIADHPVTRIASTSEVAPVSAPTPAPPPTVQAPAPVSAKPRAEAVTKTTKTPASVVAKATAPSASKTRRPTRWVSSVSQDWVVVRADASKRSRLVASIGPNSRVQLGEARGNWRRIRAKGFAGWVEQGAAFRVVASR